MRLSPDFNAFVDACSARGVRFADVERLEADA